MSIRFDGKVAIVTGGAMGIGAATAISCASSGLLSQSSTAMQRAGQAAVEGLKGQGTRRLFTAVM